MPAVSFLKAPADETGHPSTSNPLAEQTFLVDTINELMKTPEWKDMAIIITYDDSDGWYDHVMPPIISQSNDSANDALLGVEHAGNDGGNTNVPSTVTAALTAGLCGTPGTGAPLDRCGYGPRLPLVVISPFAKENFVDHTLADQSSIIRFIEDNWQTGQIGASQSQSFDAVAGSLLNLFDFRDGRDSHRDRDRDHDFDRKLILDDQTGEIAR